MKHSMPRLSELNKWKKTQNNDGDNNNNKNTKMKSQMQIAVALCTDKPSQAKLCSAMRGLVYHRRWFDAIFLL